MSESATVHIEAAEGGVVDKTEGDVTETPKKKKTRKKKSTNTSTDKKTKPKTKSKPKAKKTTKKKEPVPEEPKEEVPEPKEEVPEPKEEPTVEELQLRRHEERRKKREERRKKYKEKRKNYEEKRKKHEERRKKREAAQARRNSQMFMKPNEKEVEKDVQTFIEKNKHTSLLEINKIIIQNRNENISNQFDTNDCSSIIKLIKSMLYSHEKEDIYSEQFMKIITLFIVNNIKTNYDIQTLLILLLKEFVSNKQVIEMATIFIRKLEFMKH